MPLELAVALIFILSGFTMSFAGFGFALMSVPLLALVMPVPQAVALQFPYCFVLFAYQAWHYRKHFAWQDMKPLALGAAVGMTLGAVLLYELPGVVLKRALAVFIAAVVVLNWTPVGQRLKERAGANPWWGRGFGFLSGSFFGAYTIGGPPAALYILAVHNDPLRAKAFLATFFSVQFAIIAVVYAFTGLLTWERLGDSALYAPVVAAGSATGFWAFRHASNRLYRQVVDVLLLVTAVVLWWRA